MQQNSPNPARDGIAAFLRHIRARFGMAARSLTGSAPRGPGARAPGARAPSPRRISPSAPSRGWGSMFCGPSPQTRPSSRSPPTSPPARSDRAFPRRGDLAAGRGERRRRSGAARGAPPPPLRRGAASPAPRPARASRGSSLHWSATDGAARPSRPSNGRKHGGRICSTQAVSTPCKTTTGGAWSIPSRAGSKPSGSRY